MRMDARDRAAVATIAIALIWVILPPRLEAG